MAAKPGTVKLVPRALRHCVSQGWRCPEALARLIYLHGRRRYALVEILHQDLLSDRWSRADLRDSMSKEESVVALGRLNLPEHRHLTENKWAFHKRARSAGLPTPRALGRLNADGTVMPGAGQGAESFERLLAGSGVSGVVIKPVDGSNGLDVHVLEYDRGVLTEGEHVGESARQLYDRLISKKIDFLVEERLRSHPDLVRLTSSRAVHCLRLITCVGPDGAVHLPILKIRLAGPSSLIDNFGDGSGGAALCPLDESGRIIRIVVYDGAKQHFTRTDRLAASKQSTLGYQVPWWPEAIALAKNAALSFRPLRCIGWDIGLTENGPVVIEGNVFWDPLPLAEGHMQPVWREIEQLVSAPDPAGAQRDACPAPTSD